MKIKDFVCFKSMSQNDGHPENIPLKHFLSPNMSNKV